MLAFLALSKSHDLSGAALVSAEHLCLQVVTIDAVEDVPGGNETALQQAVTMHPVGIGLCVGDWIKEWRAYTGGILKVPSKLCSTISDRISGYIDKASYMLQ